ncbi:MAG TPA: hypothetical protein VGG97_28370 [Bryobacteraceae bacterium]|jgi:hypothetical protein
MQDTQNRRSDNRLLCAEIVQLVWDDPSGRQRRSVANLEDISLSGLCLQVENPIPTGTPIAMEYGDGELVGTIRYCRFQEWGYFLGIELLDGCRWSSQHFRPQHLLDPSDLLDQAVMRHQANSTSTL